MIYFISDCNFIFSKNNDIIIDAWNKVVGNGDVVYHIGDFSPLGFEFVSGIISRLKGEIHFLPGSNDYWMRGISKKAFSQMKSLTGQICVIEPEIVFVETGYKKSVNLPIVLCHYPMTLWQGSHSGSLHAFGHCNGKLAMRAPRSIDVSYNIFKKPININAIIYWLKERQEI